MTTNQTTELTELDEAIAAAKKTIIMFGSGSHPVILKAAEELAAIKRGMGVDKAEALKALDSLAERFCFEDERQAGIHERTIRSALQAVDAKPDAAPKSEAEPDGWQDISTAPLDRTAVIVAVPYKSGPNNWLVGEAYYDPDRKTWWWANTDYGDYTGGPLEELCGTPSHWMPLPLPPLAAPDMQNGGNG